MMGKKIKYALAVPATAATFALAFAPTASALVVSYGYYGYNAIGISNVAGGGDQSNANHIGTFFPRQSTSGSAITGGHRVICINADRATPEYLDADTQVSTNNQLGYLVAKYVDSGEDKSIYTPAGQQNTHFNLYPSGGKAALDAAALTIVARDALDPSSAWQQDKADVAASNPDGYAAAEAEARALSAEAIRETNLKAVNGKMALNAAGTAGTISGLGVHDGDGNVQPGLSYKITLTGGATFADGSTSATGTTGDSLLSFDVKVPASVPNGAKVSYSISYTGDGIGTYSYAVFSSPNAAEQNMISKGTFTAATLNDSDPDQVIVQHPVTPKLDSKVGGAAIFEGSTATDTVTVNGLAPLAGQQIKVTDTLYGPFDKAPAESKNVPSGAPVVATLTKTVSIASDGTATAEFSRDGLDASKVYVWVESVADQQLGNTVVNPVTGSFGRTAETTRVLAQPSGSTQTSARTAVVGQEGYDTFKSSGVKDALAAFPGTTATLTGQVLALPAGTDAAKADWSKATKVMDIPATSITDDGSVVVAKHTFAQAQIESYAETLTIKDKTGKVIATINTKPGTVEETTTVLPKASVTTKASDSTVVAGSKAVHDTATVSGVAAILAAFPGATATLAGKAVSVPVGADVTDCGGVDFTKGSTATSYDNVAVTKDGDLAVGEFTPNGGTPQRLPRWGALPDTEALTVAGPEQ